MKKFNNKYSINSGRQIDCFWFFLLQWLRLLVLSCTRIRDKISGIFFHDPNINKRYPKAIENKIANNKIFKMRTSKKIIKWALMLVLIASAGNSIAQGPYPSSTVTQTVCIGSQPYGVIATTGSSYSWSITPGTGNGTITSGQGTNLITVDWATAGTATLQVVETNSTNCQGSSVSIAVTIIPNNTIALTSAAGTDAQTPCINTAITNITYATTGATGATVTGLPAGVTGTWSGNVVTISGTPTVLGPFTYTVTLTGGCGVVTKTGTITVTAANTIVLTSAAGTDAQTPCINTAITNITYATTGATGATVTGLPSGVTGAWSGNVVTISGTPTVLGPFTYTVTLTGGCGVVTKTGTITVNPKPTTSPIYHN